MTDRRSQRYRLTWEFTLRDRADYALARAVIQQSLNHVGESFTGLAPDYLTIERVDPPKESP